MSWDTRSRDGSLARYIPTGAVEEILIDTLANFLDVTKNHTELPAPLEVVAGLEGIENFTLAVDPKYFDLQKFVGHIFYNTIGESIVIKDFDCDPFEVLLPLFEKIYDNAGYERPDVRTAGKNRR